MIFISESWERENKTLDKIIQLEDHTIISNVFQRKGAGGRPAIVANHKKFQIQNLTNDLIQIPWGVEAIWCLLTPKGVTRDSKIQTTFLMRTTFSAQNMAGAFSLFWRGIQMI